jgi:hypothetical protein
MSMPKPDEVPGVVPVAEYTVEKLDRRGEVVQEEKVGWAFRGA